MERQYLSANHREPVVVTEHERIYGILTVATVKTVIPSFGVLHNPLENSLAKSVAPLLISE